MKVLTEKQAFKDLHDAVSQAMAVYIEIDNQAKQVYKEIGERALNAFKESSAKAYAKFNKATGGEKQGG